MALIDVVKCEMKDGEFCQKFPSEDLRIGTQLVVYPSQSAFFVKGGSIFDEFTSGTHTIKTNNIPLLNKIINLPFGGDTPFKAEVWYVNQISKLDLAWGTPHPIQVEDPRYHIIVPVRAHGQYGLKVSNPRLFLESLIGNMQTFTADKIHQFFKGKLISTLNALIAQQIVKEQVSILDINALLLSMSEDIEVRLNNTLGKYGISIVEFSIISISVPEDDPSVIRLKKSKDFAAELNIAGRDAYQMQRSFDVLEKAASNEGAGGQMIGMGMGLGAGVNIGNTFGSMASQTVNANPQQVPPPIPQQKTFHLYINGNQVPGQSIQQICNLFQQNMIDSNTLVWCPGMPQWSKISEVPELATVVSGAIVPPPINM